MTPSWVYDARFYHIYPIGLCDAPKFNSFSGAAEPRLNKLYPWIDHILSLNLNAVYLGPVFESTEHGYDTADYFQVDRRLGDHATLKALIGTMKGRGLRVVLDGVFNHVGRHFHAFKDIQARGTESAYVDWFYHIDFEHPSPYGDPFTYEGWDGHYDLIKLDQDHPGVRQHIFDAVSLWIREFDIDGLRLAGSDTYTPDFMRALTAHCRTLKPDFWLLGEIGQSDYRAWVKPAMLDSTANYELHRALIGGFANRDLSTISAMADQQFGAAGHYRDLLLYLFADNHDVNRAASAIGGSANLFSLYVLMFTLPGVPAIYYGSEWGIGGERTQNLQDVEHNVDSPLRPALKLEDALHFPMPALKTALTQLAALRAALPALSRGAYQTRYSDRDQFVFSRTADGQTVTVAVNAADVPHHVALEGFAKPGQLIDRLSDQTFTVEDGRVSLELPAHSAVILTAC